MSTEILRPSSTVTNSLTLFGGSGTLHASWDDAMGSGDSDGAKEDGGLAESGEVHLANPTGTPNKSVNWTLRARIRYVNNLPASLDVLVKEGGTTRATFSPTVTSSWATYELSFDPSAIGNANDLRIRVDTAAGGIGDEIQIADVELEIDDTTAASPDRLPMMGVS
ncbi:MAG: hypothetical protein IH945_02020 [Armatimonadetes bacterium]|nr:hypothetical protein [Armatimonadota bacterium]